MRRTSATTACASTLAARGRRLLRQRVRGRRDQSRALLRRQVLAMIFIIPTPNYIVCRITRLIRLPIVRQRSIALRAKFWHKRDGWRRARAADYRPRHYNQWGWNGIRRDHHRRGPQRADLRFLPRGEGPEGRRARGADDGRRRGGDRRIPARLPQFGGELHRQPAQPQGHPRHGAGAARAEGRAAQDATISCPATATICCPAATG